MGVHAALVQHEAQLAAWTDRRELDAELALDQVANQLDGPQAQLEAQLWWRLVTYRLCDPSHLLVAEQRRAPRVGEGADHKLAY